MKIQTELFDNIDRNLSIKYLSSSKVNFRTLKNQKR